MPYMMQHSLVYSFSQLPVIFPAPTPTCHSFLLPLSPHPVSKLSFNFYFMTPECNQGQSHEPGCWAIDWRMTTLCVAISVKTRPSFSSAALDCQEALPISNWLQALPCGDPFAGSYSYCELMIALRSSKEGTTLILTVIEMTQREDVGLGLTCVKNPPGDLTESAFVSNCISYTSDLIH